jgi:ATP-binding cassette subfamily F protein 3
MSFDLASATATIKAAAPSLDQDLLKYMLGYLTDETSDFSNSAVDDFLVPLLIECELTHQEKLSLCSHFAVNVDQTQDKLLDISQPRMNVSDALRFDETSKKRVDIRHGVSRIRTVTTTVDSKKLRKAELKIEAKRSARGAMDLYEGQVVPEWNPEKRPVIVVNQSKQTAVGEGRGKDIKLENFDIHFAGNKILTNANLTLAYGRRYGLVGKNGIGKSTLLRAIAHKELKVPSHIRILHVEQEIAGDDTTALVSVLSADEERESLLNLEIELNVKLNKLNLSVEEAAAISEQLKRVYTQLQDIESDKAESKYFLINC